MYTFKRCARDKEATTISKHFDICFLFLSVFDFPKKKKQFGSNSHDIPISITWFELEWLFKTCLIEKCINFCQALLPTLKKSCKTYIGTFKTFRKAIIQLLENVPFSVITTNESYKVDHKHFTNTEYFNSLELDKVKPKYIYSNDCLLFYCLG